jgi:uncharacterized protein YkwD
MLKKLIAFILNFFRRKKAVIKKIFYKKYTSNEFDMKILQTINNYRESVGLNRLFYDEFTSDVCFSQLEFLILKLITSQEEFKKYGHYYFQGRSDQLKLVYGEDTRVGENLGWNMREPMSYLEAWKDSESHNEVLNGDFNHIGIASNNKYVITIYIKK